MTQPKAARLVLSVSPSARVTPGSSVTLSAKVKDSAGELINGADVTFESNNTNVATVDASGLVRGVGNGNATITVKSGDQAVDLVVPIG